MEWISCGYWKANDICCNIFSAQRYLASSQIGIDCACAVCSKFYCACVTFKFDFLLFTWNILGLGAWWLYLVACHCCKDAHSDRSDLERTGMSHGEQLSHLPPDGQRSTRHYALEWRHSDCCRKRHLHCANRPNNTPPAVLRMQSNQQENRIRISKEIYQSIKIRRSFRLDKENMIS